MPIIETEKEVKEVSQQDIARAATNDPALSNNKVVLGDKEFTLVDLPYDDYISFLSLLSPLLECLAGTMTGVQYSFPTPSSVNAGAIIKYCSRDLPEMVRICLSQTEPTITTDEIKIIGKTPLKLAGVVLKQIEQNRIISDIADFFGQIVPLLKVGKSVTSKIAGTH